MLLPDSSQEEGYNMNLIETRKSVRQYSDKPISDDVLKGILNAGRLAPSWMNSQTWQFIVVKNQETKDLLSKLSNNQSHVRMADTVIVCIADNNAWSKDVFGKVLKSRGMKEEAIDNIMTIPVYYPPLLGDATTLLRSVEQVTYAIAYMTLEAEKYGVGCCVIGALGNEVTKFAPDIYKQVKDKLNLNDKHCIITMLTLGYEKEKQPLNKYRKEFDEVISLEKLGNKF